MIKINNIEKRNVPEQVEKNKEDIETLQSSITKPEFKNIQGNPSDNALLSTALNNKVDKETGKGLSEANFTTAEKTKLDNIDLSTKQDTLTNAQIEAVNSGITATNYKNLSDYVEFNLPEKEWKLTTNTPSTVTITRDDTNKKTTIDVNSGGTGTITDVQVDGTSVVSGTVANIQLNSRFANYTTTADQTIIDNNIKALITAEETRAKAREDEIESGAKIDAYTKTEADARFMGINDYDSSTIGKNGSGKLQIKDKGITFAKFNTDLISDSIASKATTDTIPTSKAVLDECSDIYDTLDKDKENISNKITSISSTSTDTQYVSAKCIYKELAKKADESGVPTVYLKKAEKSSNKLTLTNADDTTLDYEPDIPAAMTYKGTCLQSALPTSGQSNGDYYKLSDTSGTYSGQCAIWNSSTNTWDYSSSNLTIDNTLSSTSENPVQNKVINTALGNYLPLAGGTMTGVINRETKAIQNPKTNSWLGIYGGPTDYSPCILLRGTDTAQPGYIQLIAVQDNSTMTELRLQPNGTLTWGGNNVITSAGGTMTGTIISDSSKTNNIALKNAINTGVTAIFGGTVWNDGSYIDLFGANHTGQPGAVAICARTSSTVGTELNLQANGTLTWGGKNVLVEGSSVLNNYVYVASDEITSATRNNLISLMTGNRTDFMKVNFASSDSPTSSTADYWIVEVFKTTSVTNLPIYRMVAQSMDSANNNIYNCIYKNGSWGNWTSH